MDTSSDKITLLVDGEPFFYNGIQTSPQRLMDRDGWTWSDMELVFRAAADSGFTVMGVPIRWSRIEPTPGALDWTDVERSVDLGAKYGLRLEFLWFGSQVCSFSDPRAGTPGFLFTDHELVLDASGAPLASHVTDQITGQPTTYHKLDIADPGLLSREARILSACLDHVRDYLADQGLSNVLIGVEVLNEPTSAVLWKQQSGTERSYSSSARQAWNEGAYVDPSVFNASLLWRYLNGLAEAVKTSVYPVWTRANFYVALEGEPQMEILLQLLEADRAAGRAHLDFIGSDIYTRDTEAVFRYGAESIFRTGRNLVMVMENGGHYENTDQLIFNALASDCTYHIWEVCDTMPDWPAGMYEVVPTRRELRPKAHQDRTRKLNELLRRNSLDLARFRAGGASIRFFNRKFQPVSESRELLGPHIILHKTTTGGAGIASISRDDLVLMTTGSATFDISTTRKLRSVTRGRFDARRAWSTDTEVPYTSIDGHLILKAEDYDCLRLLFS